MPTLIILDCSLSLITTCHQVQLMRNIMPQTNTQGKCFLADGVNSLKSSVFIHSLLFLFHIYFHQHFHIRKILLVKVNMHDLYT